VHRKLEHRVIKKVDRAAGSTAIRNKNRTPALPTPMEKLCGNEIGDQPQADRDQQADVPVDDERMAARAALTIGETSTR
jgi:hypothetical protein